MNASTSYTIRADDRTKAGIDSAKRNFKDLDKSAKKLSQGLKAFGVGAVAVKAFSAASKLAATAVKNLAESNADFAKSLKVGEAAMRSMTTAGEDTIRAQERLNAALTDPQVQAASRNLSDNVASFFVNMKTAAVDAYGWLTKLETKIGLTRRDFKGEYAAALDQARATAKAPAVDTDPDKYMKLVRAATLRDQKEAAEEAARAMDDFAKSLLRADEIGREMARTGLDVIDPQQLEDTRFDRVSDHIQGLFKDMPEWIKEADDEMSVYADQAARNMQDAFADFLFDPFDKGLKGMLKGFIDTMRRMIANRAAEQIFGLFDKKGGGGILGFIGGLFGGGKASGGPVSGGTSYLVGERGPELFTPGTSGHITPNHALGGGVVQNITVDARGATVDAIRAIPAAMAEAKRQAVDEVADLIRRGRL